MVREPHPIPGTKDIAAISCGAFHNLAVDTSGTVYSWGTNDYGQLGHGNTTYQTVPTRVVGT